MTPPSAIAPAAATGLAVLTVLSASELQDGSANTLRIRGIEPEDLLDRAPVQLDEAGIAHLISGKTVLVTGAGASIGSDDRSGGVRIAPGRQRPANTHDPNAHRRRFLCAKETAKKRRSASSEDHAFSSTI